MSELLPYHGNPKSHYIHGAWPEQYRPDNLAPSLNYEPYPYQFGNINLPISPFREHIVRTIHDNQVVIIQTGTGGGKTTQLPQHLFEEGYKVILTQPRIVAARNNSERIRQELMDVAGEEMRDKVGYLTQHEGDYLPSNRILAITDGKQVNRELNESHFFDEETVTIIDEAHEKNIYMAMMQGIRRYRLKTDLNSRTVIASATIDAEFFANFYEKELGVPVPIINVPGQPFEVDERIGGDYYDTIVEYALQGKNILGFVPGINNIRRAEAALRNRIPGVTILPLHGELSTEKQQRAFRKYPGGLVVLATSIAQSSLTIEGMDVVVDCGYERTSDLTGGVDGLHVRPISRAARDQRRGRISRTSPGIYHEAHLQGLPEPQPYEERNAYDKPEILRVRSDSRILKLAGGAIDLSQFHHLDEPDKENEEQARQRLYKIGALAIDGSLTTVGAEMQFLPIDPHFGRMLIASRKYSNKVRKQLIAAISAQQDDGITLMSADAQQRWNHLSDENTSDVLRNLDIFIAALDMDDEERDQAGIVPKKFFRARDTFYSLSESEEIEEEPLSLPSDEERKQLLACIIAGTDELFKPLGGGKFLDVRGKKRRVSRISSVRKQKHQLVIGAPFDLGNTTPNGSFTAKLIKGASSVTAKELLTSAPERCTLKNTYFSINEEGRPFVKKAIYFDDINTGQSIVEAAKPSTELKDYMVRSLVDGTIKQSNFENSQKVQRLLSNLRDIQSRTKISLDVDVIKELIIENLQYYIPNTVSTPAEVDAYIPEYTTDQFVQHDIKIDILRKTPDWITYDGTKLRVTYSEGDAFIILPESMGRSVPDSIPELDEFTVYVRNERERHFHSLTDAKVIAARPPRRNRRKNKPAPTIESPHFAGLPSSRPTETQNPSVIPTQRKPLNNHFVFNRASTGRR